MFASIDSVPVDKISTIESTFVWIVPFRLDNTALAKIQTFHACELPKEVINTVAGAGMLAIGIFGGSSTHDSPCQKIRHKLQNSRKSDEK